MASSDCSAVILAMEEHAILHFSGGEVVAQAKMVKTSQLLGPFTDVEVNEALQGMFPNNDQLFLMPVKGGNALSLADYSFEQLEQILAFKAHNERSFIISEEKRTAFDNLKGLYLASTSDFDKQNNLDMIKSMVRVELLEQIANNNLKGFVTYANSSGVQLLLLENRRIFSADQQKVNAAAARLAKTAQRALLPSTSSGVGNMGLTPAGKPRRRIEEDPDESDRSLDSQEDLQSDSSVSCPCEGTKTASESEHEDESPTPIMDNSLQHLPPAQFSQGSVDDGQPAFVRSNPPVAFGAPLPAISKRKHSATIKKKSKKTSKRSVSKPSRAVDEDLNQKMPAPVSQKKSSRKSDKKKKAKKAKQSKRLFKKGARNQSSSGSDSGSESSNSADESSIDSSQSSASEEVSYCI